MYLFEGKEESSTKTVDTTKISECDETGKKKLRKAHTNSYSLVKHDKYMYYILCRHWKHKCESDLREKKTSTIGGM